MRKLLLATLLILGVSWLATVRAEQQAAASTMIRYDVDSTTLTYCRVEGQGGSVLGAPITGAGRVKTSGSSATVTSETASSSALAPILARDTIFVRPPYGFGEVFAAGFAATVTVKTDADTITVDPAVDWSVGYLYSYLRPVCGTGVNDGWVDVSGATKASLTIQYDQGDLDALAWRFECKQNTPGSVPVVVYPSEGDGCGNAGVQTGGFCEYATAGATVSFTYEEFGTWDSCRIGFKVKTTDTSDAGAGLERVTGTIVVGR